MSLITKNQLSLVLQIIKKLLSFKADKSDLSAFKMWTKKEIKNSTADWNQNDSSADNYVKNRTHWEERKYETLVDNLTSEEYSNNNRPQCNFVPGNFYDVLYNGTLYKNLVCYFDGDYNIIATMEDGYPFYIDDDGGNGLCIEVELDENDNPVPFTISIFENVVDIHKLDPKYLPDEIGVQSDWNENDENAPGYIANRTHYVGPIGMIIEAEAWPTFYYPDDGDFHISTFYCPLIKGEKYIIQAGPVTLYSNAIDNDEDGPYSQLFRTAEDADNKMNAIGSFFSSREDEESVEFWIYSNATDIVSQFQGISHKVTVAREGHIIKQLDEEFLPDSARRAIIEVDKRLNSRNPEGTGYIAMNVGYTRSGTGDYSSIFGNGNEGTKRSQHVIGEYSKTDPATYAVEISEVEEKSFHYNSFAQMAEAYTFDPHTGYFKLINPIRTTFNGVVGKSNIYFIGGSAVNNAALFYKADESYRSSGNYRYVNIQTLRGKATPKYERGEYVHIVGNGTRSDALSNAHTLDWDGNAWFSGDVYVGSTSGTNRDEGSKKLATEEYVAEQLANISIETLGEYTSIILKSSTPGSNKKFRITIDDDGILSSEEISE